MKRDYSGDSGTDELLCSGDSMISQSGRQTLREKGEGQPIIRPIYVEKLHENEEN